MATQQEIDELFRQTLEGDYDDEGDEGGPWEAVTKLQQIASREVFDNSVQWCRNNKPSKRRRGIDILAQLGKTEAHPHVVFADEIYAIVTGALEDELDLDVIDSCLVALGHLGNPKAIPLILEHRSNTDPDSPDHGTTFTLRIPISVAPANDGRKPPSRLANGPSPISDVSASSIATNIEIKEIV